MRLELPIQFNLKIKKFQHIFQGNNAHPPIIFNHHRRLALLRRMVERARHGHRIRFHEAFQRFAFQGPAGNQSKFLAEAPALS